MKVAIMQPYFFPYLGYFQLISAVDRFIISDNVQYIKHGWINRNRILKPNGGWQYITVPLEKHSSKTCIKDIRAAASDNWKDKLLGQLEHYKKKAPYYKQTIELVRSCLDTNEKWISTLNAYILKLVCNYLGVHFQIEFDSEIGFDYSRITSTSLRPLRCMQINATEYINPIGGMQLYDKETLQKEGLKVSFLQTIISPYSQGYATTFEPGLSIIDILMFNSLPDVRMMMKSYHLI